MSMMKNTINSYKECGKLEYVELLEVLESYRLLLFVSFLVLNTFGHHPLLLYGKGQLEHSSKLLILCSTKESLAQHEGE